MALSSGTGTHSNVKVAHVMEKIVSAVNHWANLVTILIICLDASYLKSNNENSLAMELWGSATAN